MTKSSTIDLKNAEHEYWLLEVKDIYLQTMIISLKLFKKTNNEYFKKYYEETKEWLEGFGNYQPFNRVVQIENRGESDRQRLLSEDNRDIEEIVNGILW